MRNINPFQPSLRLKGGGMKAFTLVELIVVITILAILWTIAFISLQWYSRDARDSKRTADVWNMKTSLELFNVNTWKYPAPDNPSTISYSWDIVWYQWSVWDQVTTNLKGISIKPLDPLTNAEYVYSTIHSYKEYEVLALYEWNVAYNPVINSANAATTSLTPKVVWNYNELFVQTSNYIVPTPSIITSEPWNITLDWTNIHSQVVTNWTNIPKTAITNSQTWALNINLSVFTWSINKTSPSIDKVKVMKNIQTAYSWTSLANNDNVSYLLNQTSNQWLIKLTNLVLLNWFISTTTRTVLDCIDSWEIVYWTNDWLDTWLTCNNNIIICSWNWTWTIIASCNEWANVVWTWSDSYGNYFQWWRNKWFAFNDSSHETTQIANVDYNPLNDWSWFVYDWSLWSNRFDWIVNEDNNLWWYNWWTGTNIQKKWPCATWYHVPSRIEFINLSAIGQSTWWHNWWTNMSNILKMSISGQRVRNSGVISGMGSWWWCYWTSSPALYGNFRATFLNLEPNIIDPSRYDYRAQGCSIRCFKN